MDSAAEALVDLTFSDNAVERPIPVLQWSSDDVLEWLKNELGLAQYADAFKLNAIDGEELLDLNSGTLSNDLNVGKDGFQNMILCQNN